MRGGSPGAVPTVHRLNSAQTIVPSKRQDGQSPGSLSPFARYYRGHGCRVGGLVVRLVVRRMLATIDAVVA